MRMVALPVQYNIACVPIQIIQNVKKSCNLEINNYFGDNKKIIIHTLQRRGEGGH